MKAKLALLTPVIFLETLGETIVNVTVSGLRTFFEFLLLTLKLLWDKTVIVRSKVVNIVKYIGIFVASPFVKLSINFDNMKRDMRLKREESGSFRAALVFFPYFGKFMFGRRGFMVTAFNYTAPILSLVFLMNVVTYATTSNFTLRLVINGEFYGYVESEQVFLNAEAIVLQRVNYYGSARTIDLVPEFSVANRGSNEKLTSDEVANLILARSNYTLERAYGFLIDNVLYGAILEKDLHLIGETIDELLGEYASANRGDNMEVGFLNRVVWNEKLTWFLEESVVDPQTIISMITSKSSQGEPFLPVVVTLTESEDVSIPFGKVKKPIDDLTVGSSRVIDKGVEGINRITSEVSYINGEEIKRTVIDTTLVREPKAQIEEHGTKPVGKNTNSKQPKQFGKYIWPVEDHDGNPTGRRGRGMGGGHNGVDIPAAFGMRIVAGDSGVVVLAKYNHFTFGHTVIIQHDDGSQTLYAHASGIHVTEGQRVVQGQHIASIGATGRSFGNHLHMEVYEAGSNRRLNPYNYLPDKGP